MAEKRMFSRSEIDSDEFMGLPTSAQALYFHLGLNADDDGFVAKPRTIAKAISLSLRKKGTLSNFPKRRSSSSRRGARTTRSEAIPTKGRNTRTNLQGSVKVRTTFIFCRKTAVTNL